MVSTLQGVQCARQGIEDEDEDENEDERDGPLNVER